MSKTKKQMVSATTENNQQVIVLTKNGEMFRFPSRSHIHIIPDAIQETVTKEGLDLKVWIPRMQVPQDWSKDQVWGRMCTRALDRTSRPSRSTGPRIINRTYYFIGDQAAVALLKTPQMRQCAIIAREACGEKGCSEQVMQEAVSKHAESLRTKQEPWRIFQYYRPRLVEEKILKHS